MSKRKKSPLELLTPEETRKTLGENLSFASAEAYKLMRTNLNFSLPDSYGCKVIGITSALRGEGKSTTSINAAYTMAQTGQKVLLLEADLRLPTMAKRLKANSRPGLSNLLVGQCSGNEVLQDSGLLPNLKVIAAGDTPPNPAELLGSAQMAATIKTLAEIFDVIIIDLPPVTAVSDALIVAKLVHGMVLVVRQDYCQKRDLAEVIRLLKFSETKILGFVMTGSNIQEKNYKRYGKYAKYGYGYDSAPSASNSKSKRKSKAKK